MSEPIKTKIIDSILEVTIDRPKANAIDAKTSIILGNIFSDFRDNPNLKVAIITGGGENFFQQDGILRLLMKEKQRMLIMV